MIIKRLNIPNTLSTLRILTIPVIVYLIITCNESNFPILIALTVFSICLDFFDGYLARKLKQVTELGKILDPIADKLMAFSVVSALVIKADFPIWLGFIIIGRDLLILAASIILYKEKRVVTTSILVGKITFGLYSALIVVYILDLSEAIDLSILKHILIPLCTLFIAWSFLEYYKIYLREKNES